MYTSGNINSVARAHEFYYLFITKRAIYIREYVILSPDEFRRINDPPYYIVGVYFFICIDVVRVYVN